MKRLIGVLAGVGLVSWTGAVGMAQHVHSIPHTTTHYDAIRHRHHTHYVPHTTTRLDRIFPAGDEWLGSGDRIISSTPVVSPPPVPR